MKILYFTATGNSLHVANSIGGDLVSIPQMDKNGVYDFEDDKIGLVFPIHVWGVPSYIANFLKKASFKCDYLFAVATYGIYSGAVVKHLNDIADEAGYKFDYINRVKMVDNYLPTFDMKKEVLNEPKKRIEEQIDFVKRDIQANKSWYLKENFLQKTAFSMMARRENKPFNDKRLKVHVYGEGLDNYLIVEDSCNQCGTCQKVCPVDNIEMADKGIQLGDQCFMCMACLHHCPSNALHINGQVSRDRFINKHTTLRDIIAANK